MFPKILTVSGTCWLDGIYVIGEDVRGYPTWWSECGMKSIFTDKHGAWGITDGGWHSVHTSESCVASGDGDVHSHCGTPPQQIISWMIFISGEWLRNQNCMVTSSDTYSDLHDPSLVSPQRSAPLRSPTPPRDPDPSLLEDIVVLQQKVHQLEQSNQSLQNFSTHSQTETLRQRISQLETELSLSRTQSSASIPAPTTSISGLYGRNDGISSKPQNSYPLGSKKISTDYAKIPTESVKTPAADAELSTIKSRLQNIEQQVLLSSQPQLQSQFHGDVSVKNTIYKSPSPPDKQDTPVMKPIIESSTRRSSLDSSKHEEGIIISSDGRRNLESPSPPETTPQDVTLPRHQQQHINYDKSVAVRQPAEVPFFTQSVRDSLSSMRTPKTRQHDPNDAARFDTPKTRTYDDTVTYETPKSRVRYTPTMNHTQTPPAVVTMPYNRSRKTGRSKSRSKSRSRSRSPKNGTKKSPGNAPLRGTTKSPGPSPVLQAARELGSRSSSPLDLQDSRSPAPPVMHPRKAASTRSRRKSRSRSPKVHSVTHGFYEVYRHDRSTAVPITMRTSTPFVGLLASQGMQGYAKHFSDVELWSNATGVLNVDATPAELSIVGTEECPVQLFFRLKQPRDATSPLRPLIKVPVNSGDPVSQDRSPLGSVKSPANGSVAAPDDFFDASAKQPSVKSISQSVSAYSSHPSVRGRSRKITSPRNH